MKLWRPVVGVIVFSTLWETFLSAGYHTIKEVPRRTCQKPHVSRLSKTCSFHPNHKCQSLQPAAIPGKSHGFSAKSTRAPRASSTKTSIFFLGASIAAPRKAALGPRKSNNFAGATRWSNGGATRRWDLSPIMVWHLSLSSPTTRLVRSHKAYTKDQKKDDTVLDVRWDANLICDYDMIWVCDWRWQPRFIISLIAMDSWNL